MAGTEWDSLLDRVRQWIIVRFALNTDQDLWGWLFVIGAAAHLEHLNRSTQDWHSRVPRGPVNLGRVRFECTNGMWSDLAVAILWVADRKPTPFEQYQPKRARGLGQVARLIRRNNLLDLTTVDTLERITKLRNSVAHRGATYGVPFREGDPSRGVYRGRHVFNDPAGFSQLMDDVDKATKVMAEWLRKAGLGTGERAAG